MYLITAPTLQRLAEELAGVLHAGGAVEEVRLAAVVGGLERQLIAPAVARLLLGGDEQRLRRPAAARRGVDEQVRDPGLRLGAVQARAEVQGAEADDHTAVDHDEVGRVRVGELIEVELARAGVAVVRDAWAPERLQQLGHAYEVRFLRAPDGHGREPYPRDMAGRI